MLDRIADGRTDLVFDYIAAGNPATATVHQVSLIRYCAYYGDVSAIKFLLANGETLEALGENFDLNGACFHGHWRLCQFLIEQGADVNRATADTGETALHAVLCKTNRVRYAPLLRILLAAGADPNRATLPGVETGSFMRDCRTKGETPLHRAAAFGNEEDIRMLLEAGAHIDARDANGDTPLAWASWYLRPGAILHLLCYGDFHIHPERQKHTTCEPANGSMEGALNGKPHL
jgi:ankyrin repeat protein